MPFENNHSRHKKNFRDAQFPEDTLKIVGFNAEHKGVDVEIIRKIDNGGKKKETEVTPFVIPAEDIDKLHQALFRALGEV